MIVDHLAFVRGEPDATRSLARSAIPTLHPLQDERILLNLVLDLTRLVPIESSRCPTALRRMPRQSEPRCCPYLIPCRRLFAGLVSSRVGA